MQVTTREHIIFFPFRFFSFFFISSVNSESFLKTSVLCFTLFTQKEEQKLKIYKEQGQREMKENLKQGDKVSRS